MSEWVYRYLVTPPAPASLRLSWVECELRSRRFVKKHGAGGWLGNVWLAGCETLRLIYIRTHANTYSIIPYNVVRGWDERQEPCVNEWLPSHFTHARMYR